VCGVTGCVLEYDEIEPAAAAATTSRCADFSSHLMKLLHLGTLSKESAGRYQKRGNVTVCKCFPTVSRHSEGNGPSPTLTAAREAKAKRWRRRGTRPAANAAAVFSSPDLVVYALQTPRTWQGVRSAWRGALADAAAARRVSRLSSSARGCRDQLKRRPRCSLRR